MPDTHSALKNTTGNVATDNTQFIIPDRFRGPPLSGNGGYVAGAAAQLLNTSKPVEVTLRSPIPLDQPMSVNTDESTDSATIWLGETLIAEVKVADLDVAVPEAPSWDEAIAAAPGSPSFADNINSLVPGGRGFHPICFCCGADHKEGLQVYAAPVLGGEQVATVWETKTQWGQADGYLPDSFLWTALDCPGQFAFMADDIKTGLLGRITGKINQPARAGEKYLVTGWRIGIEGKKHFAGTAIRDREGTVLALAKAVWIGRQ